MKTYGIIDNNNVNTMCGVLFVYICRDVVCPLTTRPTLLEIRIIVVSFLVGRGIKSNTDWVVMVCAPGSR